MQFKLRKKIHWGIFLFSLLLLSPDKVERFNSKTNLISRNQHIYILPEDFEIENLFDPIGSTEESQNLHSQIESFIASLSKGNMRREMIEENSFFFIQRDIQENLFLTNTIINNFRIASPSLVGKRAEVDIKLFSKKSGTGIIYCVRKNNSKKWLIEDIEIDYQQLKESQTTQNNPFLPMPQGLENHIIP